MTEQPEQPEAAGTPSAAETGWQRRRRLAEIFGDVLPDTTADEREPSRPDGGDPAEEWLRSQVPPHHGG